MANYRLSNAAKEDLIRIYHYGVSKFGTKQADRYYYSFFEYFETIARNPYSFESISHIKKGYRRCVCGVDSIIYRIEEDRVEIIAIIGRQDLDKIFL